MCGVTTKAVHAAEGMLCRRCRQRVAVGGGAGLGCIPAAPLLLMELRLRCVSASPWRDRGGAGR